MTKDELKEKIKALVKQVYKPTPSNSINIDKPGEISLDSDKFPILLKFPSLKDTIELLLTSDYEPFITDIQWVAPKPLTFRIILTNGEIFYLIYSPKSWIAQIEGKKYYLLNIGEEEAACDSLSRMLYYGNQAAETPENEPIEAPAEEPATAEKSTEESTPEEVPAEA
jgi:hypothetical protein